MGKQQSQSNEFDFEELREMFQELRQIIVYADDGIASHAESEMHASLEEIHHTAESQIETARRTNTESSKTARMLKDISDIAFDGMEARHGPEVEKRKNHALVEIRSLAHDVLKGKAFE